jgi:protein-ribulosamine 3-kinase
VPSKRFGGKTELNPRLKEEDSPGLSSRYYPLFLNGIVIEAIISGDWTALEQYVSGQWGRSWRVQAVTKCEGGFHPAAILQGTDGSKIFSKWSYADEAGPDRLVREMEGLQLLALSRTVQTPEVIGLVADGERTALLLAAIQSRLPETQDWEKLGRQLAHLHRTSQKAFGLAQDNYFGVEKQYNASVSSNTWNQFYIERRLAPQLKWARDRHFLDEDESREVQRIMNHLERWSGPAEPPALLHGDLWINNVMFTSSGPILIDPAVYYGNREVDLAYTTLWGDQPLRFYEAYHESFPLAEGHEERRSLWLIYMWLAYVNYVGREYVPHLRKALERYS